MKFTNVRGFPKPLVNFLVKDDDYTRGEAEISVTGLLKPPRMLVLSTPLGAPGEVVVDTATIDVSDMMAASFGKVFHAMMASGMEGEPGWTIEERYHTEEQGITISGAIDAWEYLPDGTISIHDYKCTTCWSLMFSGFQPKEKWIHQMNLYALLLRRNGLGHVSEGRITAWTRDWIPSKAAREKNYPDTSVFTMEVPIWTPEQQEEFLAIRVRAYIEAKSKLPECTPAERWLRNEKWVVMKEGRKSALPTGQLDTEEEAIQAMRQFKKSNPTWDLRIEKRTGQNIRCEKYCSVSHICQQWQQLKKESKKWERNSAIQTVDTRPARKARRKLFAATS